MSFLEETFSLEGKVAIVTGGARGLGKGISESLLKAGASVVIIDVLEESLKATVDDFKSQDLKAAHAVCDLTDEQEIKKVVLNTFLKHGRIDILVNNAGVTLPAPIFEYPQESWDTTYKINLLAPYLLSKEVVLYMKKNGKGSIINITSLNAELAFPNNPAYVTFKGALKQLSKSLALEFGPYNIRVNNIGPGYMKTEMTRKSWANQEVHDKRCEKTALGRWGKPDDLVGLSVFLASDASSYITGQDIYVDGGWLIKGL